MTTKAQPLVSVAVPCYEMGGRGAECLDACLRSIAGQDYPELEVVVADHSRDDAVLEVCRRYADLLRLTHLRNSRKRGSCSANLNDALDHCSGSLIKVLCQDDFLVGARALSSTVRSIGKRTWLVTRYATTHDRETFVRVHTPRLNERIATSNTIGTHSCLTVRADDAQPFDEDLIWLMDCEYYRRLLDQFGPPVVLRKITVAQLLWEGQVTNTRATPEVRQREQAYVCRRHPEPAHVPRAAWAPIHTLRDSWRQALHAVRVSPGRLLQRRS